MTLHVNKMYMKPIWSSPDSGKLVQDVFNIQYFPYYAVSITQFSGDKVPRIRNSQDFSQELACLGAVHGRARGDPQDGATGRHVPVGHLTLLGSLEVQKTEISMVTGLFFFFFFLIYFQWFCSNNWDFHDQFTVFCWIWGGFLGWCSWDWNWQRWWFHGDKRDIWYCVV